MKKKILALILALSMAVSLVTPAVATGTEGGTSTDSGYTDTNTPGGETTPTTPGGGDTTSGDTSGGDTTTPGTGETTPPVVDPQPEPCKDCGQTEGHADSCATNCTCKTEDGVHVDGCAIYICPECKEMGDHADDCSTLCSCDSKNDFHAKDCHFYVEPEEPQVYTRNENGYYVLVEDETLDMVDAYNGKTVYLAVSKDYRDLIFSCKENSFFNLFVGKYITIDVVVDEETVQELTVEEVKNQTFVQLTTSGAVLDENQASGATLSLSPNVPAETVITLSAWEEDPAAYDGEEPQVADYTVNVEILAEETMECQHCGKFLEEGMTHKADCLSKCTCTPAEDAHQEGCPLWICSACGVMGGTHADDCATLCTCDPKPAEGEAHPEGCPLYEAPQEILPVVCETCGQEVCVCCTECHQATGHLETCSQWVCEDCGKHDCTCCDECGQADGHTKECSQYVPVVGDVIWIKSGSVVYKDYTKGESIWNSHTVWFNYEMTIKNIITDEAGNVWYEFDGKGTLLASWSYVKGENTSATEPEEPIPSCSCGENAPENLANHADSCPYKTYVKTLFEGKSAEEIYADWKNYDKALQDDLLNMLEAYDKQKFEELTALIGPQDPTRVELEDGVVVSVEGIPEDAKLMVEPATEEKEAVADEILAMGSSFDEDLAKGGEVFRKTYNISVDQDGSQWQPQQGESVDVVLDLGVSWLNYRTYIEVIHILDTADAINAAENKYLHFGENLEELFPEAVQAAADAGYPEDVIVYTIMSPETGEVSYDTSGKLILHSTSFSDHIVTAFNVDNSEYRSVTPDTGLKLNKTADVSEETGKGTVTLESYVKGSVESTPTDVVLVIDHSGSMWTAVQPGEQGKLTFSQLDAEKGARRGYYVAFDDKPATNEAAQKGNAYLLKYAEGKWQIGGAMTATIYEKGEFLGFIEVIDRTNSWEDLENPEDYIYAQSISGALYDALNIFMEEMENAVNCRVAVVTFAGTVTGKGKNDTEKNNDIWRKNAETDGSTLVKGEDFVGSGIFINGELTWDKTVPTLPKDKYKEAFEDPTTAGGKDILYDTINKIDTNYGNTPTALGLLYARRLFIEDNRKDAQKIAIVFTDGRPSPAYLGTRSRENCDHVLEDYKNGATYSSTKVDCDFCHLVTTYDPESKTKGFAVRSTYVDQAKSLREDQKATVYSIGPSAGKAGVDVLKKMASSDSHVFNVGGDDLAEIFHDIAGVIVSASQEVNKNSVLVDKMSDSFKLPANANTNDIKIYTAKYQGIDKNGKDVFAEPVELKDAVVEVDKNTNTVKVSGFEYDEQAVFMAGDTPNGSKLIVEIPIEPHPGFLGGEDVETNDSSSGIYNGEASAGKFPMPKVDVNVKEVQTQVEAKDIYLSQQADLPDVIGIGKYKMGGESFQIDGHNNAYVDIQYKLIPKPAEGDTTEPTSWLILNVPAGTTYSELKDLQWDNNGIQTCPLLTYDTEYQVTCTVTSTGDKQLSVSSDPDTAEIQVYKPTVTFKDSAIDFGEKPVYDSQNFVSVVWKHGDTVADTNTMGTAPKLEYTYSPEAANSFVEDTNVKVIVAAKEDTENRVPRDQDITQYVTFFREACNFAGCTHTVQTNVSATDENRVNFVVHLNSFDLVIEKSVDGDIDDYQSFVFKVTGPNEFSMDVVIVGEGSATIKNLPAGVYTVKELEDWSWRYKADDAVQEADAAEAQNGKVTVSFENEREIIYWLSGDSWCENRWTKENNAITETGGPKPERVS